jgi:hypothetical protein
MSSFASSASWKRFSGAVFRTKPALLAAFI